MPLTARRSFSGSSCPRGQAGPRRLMRLRWSARACGRPCSMIQCRVSSPLSMRCPPTGLLGRLHSKTAQVGLADQSLDGAARMGDSAMLKHVSSRGLAQGAAGLAGRLGISSRCSSFTSLAGPAGCQGNALMQYRCALGAPDTGTPWPAGATAASVTCCPDLGTAIFGTEPEIVRWHPRGDQNVPRGQGTMLVGDCMGPKAMRVTCTAPQDGQGRKGCGPRKHC